MQILTRKTARSTPTSAALGNALAGFEARIAVLLSHEVFLLDNGRSARRALSCVVEPLVGDRVAAASASDGCVFILHVLERLAPGTASLSVAGASGLQVRQQSIALHAGKQLVLSSAGDVDVTAATGSLRLSARNLFVSVIDSIVEQANHYVGKFAQCLLDARSLLRITGGDAIVTATRDVKIDGERINLG